ncbi:MAG: DEAD/DEAH box helicase [Muribaculum sp.]|nr:DEAD/DEAH box helicase [Muribaculaceae bacterium]MCM1081028.1 DEAD/DEAH box helicase [Muribaculum sp.]
MERNNNLRLAWEYAENTSTSIFLTGKAGTGKTTFLRELRKRSEKTIVVVAPSGVAAINAGGTTIHSFFQLPLSPYIPGSKQLSKFSIAKEKQRIMRSIDLLVIDEISMVRCDILDAIDATLRRVRKNQLPFGGVQLLMIGDLRQLSPVVTSADEAVLSNYYSTFCFYSSKALSNLDYVTIQLSKVYRQQDNNFLELLNHVRDNCLSASDFQLLESRYTPSSALNQQPGTIRLTAFNRDADTCNQMALLKLPGEMRTYKARVEGMFPDIAFPTEQALTLKVGAQVMLLKNDLSADHRYYNGKIGTISIMQPTRVAIVCTGETEPIWLEYQTWENQTYTIDESTNTLSTKTVGKFSQLPLRLAWAITIHKSQGLTFDNVIVDAGMSFAPGQVYVALSRCRTLEGLTLASRITNRSIIPDISVNDYIQRQNENLTNSRVRLAELKSNFRRKFVKEAFDFSSFDKLHFRLLRLLEQTYSNMFPTIVADHKNAASEFYNKIICVAEKWQKHIDRTSDANLFCDEIQTRYKGGAAYFKSNFRIIFGDWIHLTAKVKSSNKEATRKVAEAYSDVMTEYRRCMELLSVIESDGIDPNKYLAVKRKAIYKATLQEIAVKKPTKKKSKKITLPKDK